MINGTLHTIQATFINDDSDREQVETIFKYLMNERNTQLFLAPYSSTLTLVAAKLVQSKGAVIVSGGAAATNVFQGRPNVFGLLAPASSYLSNIFKALDANASDVWALPTSRASIAPKTVFYFQEDLVFTKAVCSQVPAHAAAHSMKLIGNHTMPLFKSSSERNDGLEALVQLLNVLQPDFLIGCTYALTCKRFLKETVNLRV